MMEPASKRYIVEVREGPPHGDLYELEQSIYFLVIDTTTDKVIMSFNGEIEANLSREEAQWDDFEAAGVCQVTISEDQRTVLVEYHDGTREQFDLPE